MLCIAALVLLYLFNPENSTLAPKCIFRALTGWECPGCGSGRAMHHLLHLRIARAVAFNPVIVLGIPYAGLLAWLQYLGGKERYPGLHNALTSRTAIWIAVGILAAYTVVRNVI